jgi:HPt (histidine-containing phosphotransfer) domain-containing protein
MGLTREAIQRIRDAVGDDDLVIADILQSFLDEVDGLLDQLTDAAASDDLKTLHRIAHTLKSSCRDLGDEAAGDLCAKLESDARAGEVSGAVAASRMIANRIHALKSEVVGYLVSGQESSIMP